MVQKRPGDVKLAREVGCQSFDAEGFRRVVPRVENIGTKLLSEGISMVAQPATAASAETRATLTRTVVPDGQVGGRSLNESFRRGLGNEDGRRTSLG